MKVPDLKAELKSRNLKVSGKKEELIQRLLQAQSNPTPAGAVPSTAKPEAPQPAQTKRKAEEITQKNDPKKKKPQPKEELSDEESEDDEGSGSKDDYKDEGGDEDDDDDGPDEDASDDLHSLTPAGNKKKK